MEGFRNSLRRLPVKASFAASVLTGMVYAVVNGGLAGAASNDPVTAGFTTVQTNLTNYVGLGVALVIAVFLVGIGVGLLVKWARRAVKAG